MPAGQWSPAPQTPVAAAPRIAVGPPVAATPVCATPVCSAATRPSPLPLGPAARPSPGHATATIPPRRGGGGHPRALAVRTACPAGPCSGGAFLHSQMACMRTWAAPGTRASWAIQTNLSYLVRMIGDVRWPGVRRLNTTSLALPGLVGSQMARTAWVSSRARSTSTASCSQPAAHHAVPPPWLANVPPWSAAGGR